MEYQQQPQEEQKERKLTRLGGEVKYFNAPKMQPGQMIKGDFLDTQIDAKFGGKKYRVLQPNGSVHIVNGTGILDRKMEDVKSGMYVEITYLGKKIIEGGIRKGTEAHDWDVLVDLASGIKNTVNSDEVPF